MRREVVELRLPAAGNPEPRSAPSPAAPSGASPVPALAAPRARSLVQPEPWGRSRSEHHGAGGLVSLGAPPRPPAPRSRGHPRWVWHGEGAGRCGCAHAGTPGPRELLQQGGPGRWGDPGCRRRGPEGDQSSWRWGSHSEDHTGDQDRPPLTTPELPGLREAPGTLRGKFSETGLKVFLRRVCGALCVRARFPPSEPPHAFSKLFQLAASASGLDWARCLRGSPLPCPSPSPPPPALWV